MPEDWSRPAGRQIPLHVVVVPAVEREAGAAPFVWLAGGPGIAATESAPAYLGELSAHRQWRDVVLVDQRGTGHSNPLRCPEIETRGPLEEMYPLDAVRSCRARLEKKADLRQYTTANSVRDLEAVREALGYERVDLAGLSYGSLLALSYLRAHPDRVRAAVLLGTAPPGKKYPLHHGENAQRALDVVFAECEADPPCRKAFPEVRRDWETVLERLEASPVTLTRPSPRAGAPLRIAIRRDTFGHAFGSILGSAPRDVPFVVHEMAIGNFGPFLDGLHLDQASPFAEGLYLSLDCTEETSRITDAEAEAAARGNYLGAYRISEQRRACREWPLGAVPPDHAAPVTADVPVLLMTGSLDASTPPAWAEEVAGHLARARHVIIEDLPHFPDGLSHMECYDRIIDAFLRDPQPDKVDTSCLPSMKPPPFRTVAGPSREDELDDEGAIH